MSRLPWILALGLLAVGCDEGADAEPNPAAADAAVDAAAPEDAAVEAEVDPISAALECEAQNLALPPLQGPGIEDGVFAEPLPEGAVISGTVLFLMEGEEPGQVFLDLMTPILGAMNASEGLIGQALTFDLDCGIARTFTVWRDLQSMYDFVGSEAHVAAIARWSEFSRPESAVVHWDHEPGAPPPTWQDAIDRANAAEGIGAVP